MEDMISRKAAIEALQEHRNLFCDNTPETFSKLSYAEKSRVDELDMAIATLINLPSAQPETHEERTETHSCDCISRQDAIDAFYKHPNINWTTLDVLAKINALPPAQPELPEWAKKVEEYRKSAPSHIHNPLAWALYQTWKEYDR